MMLCARCNGFMVSELVQVAGMNTVTYRCIHCGDVIDQKILTHRSGLKPPSPTRARTPVFQRVRRKTSAA
jgi:hypothetical protein